MVAGHVLRPVLIGGATRLPFLWVLFGILGGVETWGLLGLFLGPAVMAALILLWRGLTHGPARQGPSTHPPRPLPLGPPPPRPAPEKPTAPPPQGRRVEGPPRGSEPHTP